MMLARRVLTNASQKLDAETRGQDSFIQLLHLAIYEQALSSAESESDILLLHLLLVNLVQKLGVNCLCTGLPMMFRLQDEVENIADPVAMVSLASLVHGYFWAISQTFSFENTALGREIYAEMWRRDTNNLWLKSIRMPPLPLEKLQSSEASCAGSIAPQLGPLKYFTSRQELVANISSGYSQAVLSPPTSPHASPQKQFSRPHFRKLSTSASVPIVDKNLSSKVQAQMLEDWTREIAMAAVERTLARSTSLTGSKSGSGSGRRSQLSPEGRATNGSPARSAVYNVVGGSSNALRPPHRQPSNRSSRTAHSDSSARSIVRVQDLKRVLSGSFTGLLSLPTRHEHDVDDRISESMVTASFSDSETSLQQERNGIGSSVQKTRSSSISDAPFETPAATPTALMREADPLAHDIVPLDDDVPPVPMLPANLRATNLVPPHIITSEEKTAAVGLGGESATRTNNTYLIDATQGWARTKPGKVDLLALLNGLDTTTKRPSTPLGAPPY